MTITTNDLQITIPKEVGAVELAADAALASLLVLRNLLALAMLGIYHLGVLARDLGIRARAYYETHDVQAEAVTLYERLRKEAGGIYERVIERLVGWYKSIVNLFTTDEPDEPEQPEEGEQPDVTE